MWWDLIQQVQLSDAAEKTSSIEARVAQIEEKVERQGRVLVEIIRYLEKRDGADVDGDGTVTR